MKAYVKLNLNQYQIEMLLEALYRYLEENKGQLDENHSDNLISQFKGIYKLFAKG